MMSARAAAAMQGRRRASPGAPGVDLFSVGTFTRSSIKHVQSGAESLVQVASGDRAIEDRGDGLGQMLLLEGSATSRARNSGPDSGGTGWTTASATVTFAAQDGPLGVGTAAQANLNAVSTARVVGTNTNLPTDNFNVVFAIWLRGAVGGEVVRLTWRDKTGTTFYSATEYTLTTTWQRYFVAFNAGAGANTLQMGVANSAVSVVAKTVYFTCAFLDWGPVAQSVQAPSSYIHVPSTAQTTRAGDLLSLAVGTDCPTSVYTDGCSHTFVPDISSADLVATDANAQIRLLGVDNRNYLRFYVASGVVNMQLVQGNVGRALLTGVTWSRYQPMSYVCEPALGRLTLSGATTGNGTNTGTANSGWGEAGATIMVVGASQTGSVPAFGRYARYLGIV